MKTSIDTIKKIINNNFSDRYKILDLSWVLVIFISVFSFCLFLFIPFSSEIFINSHLSNFYLNTQFAFNESINTGILNPTWISLDSGSPLFAFLGKLNYHLNYWISSLFNTSLLTSSKLILVSIFFLGFLGAYLFFRNYFARISALCGALIFTFFPTQLAHVFFVFSPSDILGGMTLIIWLLWAIIKFNQNNTVLWGSLISLFTGLIGFSVPISLIVWTPFILLFIFTEKQNLSGKIIGYFLLGIGLTTTSLLQFFSPDIVINTTLISQKLSPLSFEIFSFKYWAIDPIIAQNFTNIQYLSIGILAILIGGFFITFQNLFQKQKTKSVISQLTEKLKFNTTRDNTENNLNKKSSFQLSLFSIISLILILIIIYFSPKILATSALGIPLTWKILSVLAFITGLFTAFLAQSWSQKIYFSRVLVLGVFISILWMSNLPYLEGTNLSNWQKYPAPERSENFNKSYIIPNLEFLKNKNNISSTLISGEFPLEILSQEIKNPEEFFIEIKNSSAQNIILKQKYSSRWNVYINNKKTLHKKSINNFIQVYLPPGQHNLMFKLGYSNLEKLGNGILGFSLLILTYLISQVLIIKLKNFRYILKK